MWKASCRAVNNWNSHRYTYDTHILFMYSQNMLKAMQCTKYKLKPNNSIQLHAILQRSEDHQTHQYVVCRLQLFFQKKYKLNSNPFLKLIVSIAEVPLSAFWTPPLERNYSQSVGDKGAAPSDQRTRASNSHCDDLRPLPQWPGTASAGAGAGSGVPSLKW